MKGQANINKFVNTLKEEVAATKNARKTIKDTANQSQEQYYSAVLTAHSVVGSRIPSRTSNLRTTSKLSTKSKSPKAPESPNPQPTVDPEVKPIIQEELHVYFDPEQNIEELLAYKPNIVYA